MARSKVRTRIDFAAIGELATSPAVRELVESKAAEVAAAVEAEHPIARTDWGTGTEPVPVRVFPAYVSKGTSPWYNSRPVVNVVLAHPSGEALEAKYGYLSRAIVAVGLEPGRHSNAAS